MTPDRDGPFAGFREPHDHWFKTPHALIDALPSISSMAELKVLLYVLRHTWGYQEYDAGKRITLDEFSHGRYRRDGSRIDNGTGLSTHGAKSGVRAAVAHGFLIRESDGRDAARSAYTYRLRLGPDQAEADRSPVGTPPETDGCPVGTPGGSRRDTRSGKETDAERNQIPPADGGEHGLVGRDQQTGAERRAADEAFER
ncbi:MAG: hypothetical protein MUF84_20110, partial [Anaerolineae bacterium]|nr:hypothetical protein [Anaerolineae bacterium]